MYVVLALIRTMWSKLFMKPHRGYATLIIELISGKMIKYNAK